MRIEKDDVKHDGDNPFDKVHGHITKDMNITAGAFRLYIVFWNANPRIFTPSTKSLATLFKVKPLTIKRWMKELRELGYIHTETDTFKDKGGFKNDTTIYVHPYPIAVSKKIPEKASKMIPITNTILLCDENPRIKNEPDDITDSVGEPDSNLTSEKGVDSALVLGSDGKYYTQKQLDNYEDIPI